MSSVRDKVRAEVFKKTAGVKEMTEGGATATKEKNNDAHIVSEFDTDTYLLELFGDSIVTLEEIEEMEKRRFLVDGLMKDRTVTVVYGRGGSGKTTIVLYWCISMIEDGKNIVYINMDGDNPMTKELVKKYPRKFLPVQKGGAISHLEKLFTLPGPIAKKTVIIFDTYKKFVGDVNMKRDNKEFMEKLRELQQRGATLIPIAHTNKDSKDVSGTADIEQDGDGMLRVDSIKNADGSITISVKLGGRTRWTVEPTTYNVPSSATPNPFEIVEIEYVDVSKFADEGEEAKSIEKIKNIIENIGDVPQTKLVKDIADNSALTTRDIPKILEKYDGRHWESRYEKHNNRTTWVLL